MSAFDRDEAILAELLAADPTPPIPDAFRRALWQELLAAHAAAGTPPAAPPVAPSVWSAAPPVPSRAPRRRPANGLQPLATAALVLLTLASLLGLPRLEGATPSAPGRPLTQAATTTPDEPALLRPGGPPDQLILRRVIDAAPQETVSLKAELYQKAAGASWTTGTAASTGVGPMAYQVQAGSVQVQADHPVEVTHAGVTARVRAARIGPGDELFAPTGVAVAWRADGNAAVTYLDLGLTTGDTRAEAAPPLHRFGEQLIHVAATPDASGAYAFTLTLPVELAVRRLVLPPGGVIANPAPTTRAWVAVGSGVLAVDWARPDDPSAALGARRFTAFSSTQISGAPIVATSLRNAGSTPLVLLLLTASSAPATAAPT